MSTINLAKSLYEIDFKNPLVTSNIKHLFRYIIEKTNFRISYRHKGKTKIDHLYSIVLGPNEIEDFERKVKDNIIPIANKIECYHGFDSRGEIIEISEDFAKTPTTVYFEILSTRSINKNPNTEESFILHGIKFTSYHDEKKLRMINSVRQHISDYFTNNGS